MEYIELNPIHSDDFQQKMLNQEWVIHHQDAGQTHLVGWGYEIVWQKADSQVILRYSNKQDSETALLEISPSALAEVQALIEHLYG